jgi:glycosyltransferase involved in cell wall biosynthesis
VARICVIRQQEPWSPRAAREVAALADAGHEVHYIALYELGAPLRERRGRVTTWRLRAFGGRGGPAHYLLWYGSFFLQAAILATVLHLRRPFQLVQVNTLPDALVFAAALPRMLGARVLLDLQEAMPEFFTTRFHTGMTHPAVRVIAVVEQLSIRFADHVITPTKQLRDAFVARGARPSAISVVMDGADEETFHPLTSVRPDPSRFTLVSHGTIEERYGLDTAIRAVAKLRPEIPEIQLRIIGHGSDTNRLRGLAKDLAVEDRVSFSKGFVPVQDLVEAIATSDIGVVALKRDAFRDLALAGKMFDFIAMGVPMVVARTRSVDETFPPGCFETFESDDAAGLAEGIRRLYADPDRRARLADQARVAAEPFRWVHEREHYLQVVNRLLQTPRSTGLLRRAAASSTG